MLNSDTCFSTNHTYIRVLVYMFVPTCKQEHTGDSTIFILIRRDISHNYWPRSARSIYSNARVNSCGNLSTLVWIILLYAQSARTVSGQQPVNCPRIVLWISDVSVTVTVTVTETITLSLWNTYKRMSLTNLSQKLFSKE